MRSKLFVFVSKWRWWVGVGLLLASLGLWARWDFATLQQKHEAARQALAATATYRDLLDLHAQQSMAEFAYGVLLFSAFGLAVSITGAIALFATLRQNRQMIEATRDIGENQTRAYLFAKSASLEVTNGEAGVVCLVAVTNAGATPALNVSIDAALRDSAHERKGKPAEFLPMLGRFIPIVDEKAEAIQLVAEWSDYQAWLAACFGPDPAKHPHRMFYLKGRVEYQDVFGVRWRTKFELHGALPERGFFARNTTLISGGGGGFVRIGHDGQPVR